MANILVVEDEQLVAEDIETGLVRLGHTVLGTAISSEEALKIAWEHRPDIVLMDIHIKGDIDGIETALMIRKQFHVPVVFLTAYADEATVSRAKLAEAHGYLVKPFKTGELRGAVEVALHKFQIEAQVREREQWFSTTLRAIGDAVVAVDTHGAVSYLNPVAERLLGIPRGRAVGLPVEQVVRLVDERTREPVQLPVAEALSERRTVHLPVGTMLQAPSGDRYIDESAAPILTDEGQLLGAVLVLRDLTAQRQLQQVAAMNDRLAALATLAAGIAHEVNNPLTYMMFNSEFVRDGIAKFRDVHALDANEAKKAEIMAEVDEMLVAMEHIDAGNARIRLIIDDLRLFCRGSDEQRSPLDPHTSLNWALRVTRRQAAPKARVFSQLLPCPKVKANDVQLGQVFVSILVNAIQAIPEGNPNDHRIVVRTDTDERGWAVITVADTGVGVDEQLASRIFEPFASANLSGAGMGLGFSICHGVIESMGGTISVQGQAEGGSIVTITLPPHVEPVCEPEETVDGERIRGRILIVDDEPMVAQSIAGVLGKLHQVEISIGGADAIARMRRGERFDLILCDLVMPQVSGPDVHRALGDFAPEQTRRLMFLTGAAFSRPAVEFLAKTQLPHLTKPIESRALHDKIQRALRELGPAEAAPAQEHKRTAT